MEEYPEPEGYFCSPGFVKSNPLNNAAYLEGFKDDPWYDLLVRCDAELEALCPGYNIVQIKEKFGGLRYYVHPETPEMSAVIRRYEREVDKL